MFNNFNILISLSNYIIMNLQEFTSPLPKPWLIINADTINANTASINTSYTLNDISTGNVLLNAGTGTLNLTPENIVSGTIGVISAGTLTLQLPTATVLNAYFTNIPSFDFLNFKFTICVNTGATVHLLLATGITTYNAASSPITFAAGTQRILTFTQSVSDNWVIYF
jgi:hypothetical protein